MITNTAANRHDRPKGSDTELAKDAIPYYYALDVYAPSGSKTETFVKNEKESRGDKCKMAFHALDEFKDATSITLGENDLRIGRQETKTLTVTASPEGAQIPSSYGAAAIKIS